MADSAALVTYSGLPDLSDDDRLLIPALERLGVNAVPVVWDAGVEWGRFDHVVIRSCWDYHLRAAEFLRWVDGLERLGAAPHNSARLVRWNADKRYLRQLQGSGVRIAPTVWVEDSESGPAPSATYYRFRLNARRCRRERRASQSEV